MSNFVQKLFNVLLQRKLQKSTVRCSKFTLNVFHGIKLVNNSFNSLRITIWKHFTKSTKDPPPLKKGNITEGISLPNIKQIGCCIKYYRKKHYLLCTWNGQWVWGQREVRKHTPSVFEEAHTLKNS